MEGLMMQEKISRRAFTKRTALFGIGIGMGLRTGALDGWAASAVDRVSGRFFEVESIKRTTVKIPFRGTPERAMNRELPHWRYSEIFQVELKSGQIGIGETLLYYTWGVSSDEDVSKALGRNALDLMWDDGLGAGLQMALFDAVAKTAEVPVHRLLGSRVHEKTPLSWWNIDMPTEDMASECREAYRSGYMSYKTKGRPWFDISDQVKVAAKAVPAEFKIDMDFNDTLLTADQGIPILKELERYPQIDIYETPIPQRDVEGNRRIREATRVNIALHYGTPPPEVVVREGVCDGFVIGGGARRVMQQGQFAGEVKMPFWLQLVGTGITAAFSLHFGAVLRQARWPAVNCHQLYTHSMLTEPINVVGGDALVPEVPGIGYALDEDALERFRVERPLERPDPPRLVETSWPDGRKMYFASSGKVNFMLTEGIKGSIPYYVPGVDTRQLPNDGSAVWKELYDRARNGAFITEG
jgi:L-alanine-DL-glutamate epimerase-like enolase superfamily enzyme